MVPGSSSRWLGLKENRMSIYPEMATRPLGVRRGSGGATTAVGNFV